MKTLIYISVGLPVLLWLLPLATSQDTDTVPPQLAGFGLSPTTVDVSAGAQTLTVSVRATDDLSGVEMVRITLRRPSGELNKHIYAWRTSYDPDLYEGSDTITQWAEDGIWTVHNLELSDFAGNRVSFDGVAIEAMGFPVDVTVISPTPDTEGPTLESLAIAPSAVDVSAGGQAVTLTLELINQPAGVDFVNEWGWFEVSGEYCSPSRKQCRYMRNEDFTLASGDIQQGTWSIDLFIARYSEPGEWTIEYLKLRDAAGNYTTISGPALQEFGRVYVSSTPSDTSPPELNSLTFFPRFVNTSIGDEEVTVSMHITDDRSGASFSPDFPDSWMRTPGVVFKSPSGQQCVAFARVDNECNIWTPPSVITRVGTPTDGTWSITSHLPQYSEAGTWTVNQIVMRDRVRNTTYLDYDDLIGMGFVPQDLELTVIRPSLVVDGSISWDGGIVEDDTFGARASLTCPSGVLSGSTDVAIDVLDEAPSTPPPTGFEAVGTRFVNIHLSPEPAFPLPAPGMSLTLPVEQWTWPGAILQLFRVNPDTGALEAAVGVNGLAVIGTVDADGMSATFSGIAGLSVVVGALPDPIPVTIDIKPAESANSINLRSLGNVPVAMLSSASFDAQTVNLETVTLLSSSVKVKRNGEAFAAVEDVNGDGLPDVVVHFDTEALQLGDLDQEAVLEAWTTGGLRIRGVDTLRVVP